MATQQEYNQLVADNSAKGISTPTIDVVNGLGLPAGYVNPNTVSSATMAPAGTVTVPPPPVDNTNYAGITASGASMIPPPVTEDPKKALNDYAALLGTPPSTADLYTSMYGQPISPEEYQTQQKQVKDLTAQLNAITAEGQVASLKLPSEGISQVGINARNISAEREIAIRALPVQAALAAAQGNLTLAQDKIDKLFQFKSDDITNQYNYKKDLLDKNYDIMTAAQKEKADAKQKEDDRAYTTLTNNLNQAQTWATTAISQGQGQLASQIMALDPKSADYQTKLGQLAGQIKPILTTAQKNAGLTSIPTTTTTTDAPGQTTKTTGSIHNDVQAVLEGRNTLYNIRQTMGRTNAAAAYMQQMRDQITAVDPNFDFVASDAGGKSVSTSYVQKAKIAINAILPNIDKVVELSNQVNRVGVAGVDDLLQKAKVQIGNQSVTNFKEAQKLIADELGVALGGGTMSDMKLQLGFDVTDPSVKPEVFASNMALVKTFLENRVDALDSLRYASSTVTSKSSLNPNDINYTLKSSAGSDGYVSPESWSKMENLYVQEGGTAEDFTNQYGSFKNPNNKNYK